MKSTMALLKKVCMSGVRSDIGFGIAPEATGRGPGSCWATTVAEVEITVRARPATASTFIRFKEHLHAREETLLASSARFLLEARFLGLPFRPHQRFWRRCLRSLRPRSGCGRGVQHAPHRSLKKLNASYAAIGKVSRWPLVHPDLCKTLGVGRASAASGRADSRARVRN